MPRQTETPPDPINWRFVIDGENTGWEPLSEADRAQAVIDSVAEQARFVANMHARVKEEAQRRIVVLTGASDLQTCMIKQLNALMRATELTNKKASGQTLTDAETAEANALTALAEAIQAIRSASNAIEAMSPIPADFKDDKYWLGGQS